MTTYTLTANKNIDELPAFNGARTGGDNVYTNGYTFICDQDTRGGLGGSATTSFGSCRADNTTGGTFRIDARKVRWIPFTNGTGNVPAWNTLIVQGNASGKLIGVFASTTSASTATGAAMPASGFIKVKQWNDVNYGVGALSNIGADASGPDVAGWIEFVGDEATFVSGGPLSYIEFLGEWFELGTTDGTAQQQFQVPNNGNSRYVSGVFVETSAGSGNYEFYPVAGTATTNMAGTEAERGKFCWATSTGLIRLGGNGTQTAGYVPPAGRKVVIGNIFLENCTTAARGTNVIPNSNLNTRYKIDPQYGANVTIDKVSFTWNASMTRATSMTLSNTGFTDNLQISYITNPISFTNIGIGGKATTDYTQAAQSISYCTGTLTNCTWSKVSSGASNGSMFTYSTLTITGNRFTNSNGVSPATTLVEFSNDLGSTMSNSYVIGGTLQLTSCVNTTITNTTYAYAVSGTTGTTNCAAVVINTNNRNCTIDNIIVPVLNWHPYQYLVNDSATSNNGCKIRNIGTFASPVNLGTFNSTATAINVAGTGTEVKRVYVYNTRTNPFVTTGSFNATLEHVVGDYADAITNTGGTSTTIKAAGGTPNLTWNTNNIPGTHWMDAYTSSTTGRIQCIMSPPTPATSAYVTLSGGAFFTGQGSINLDASGRTGIWETPYYIIGHSGFANLALQTFVGSVSGNYSTTYYNVDFQIDKNDGNGYGAWTTASAANLSAVTGINAALGFKLKVRIAAKSANTERIQGFFINTISDSTIQAYQYPLDTSNLTVNGLANNSIVKVTKVSDGTVLGTTTAPSGTATFTGIAYAGAVYVEARCASSAPYYQPWTGQATLVSGSTVTVTALQVRDDT